MYQAKVEFPEGLGVLKKISSICGKRYGYRLQLHNCTAVASYISVTILYVWGQVWDQDSWILAKFRLCVFMDWDGVQVHTLTNKDWPYPAILTNQDTVG